MPAVTLASPATADTAPAAGTPSTVSADALPTWQLNGVVWSEVTVGNSVYATGSFTKARPPGVAAGGTGEIAAANIFAFDITTGNPLSNFSHSLNAQGLAVTASPDGTRVYVGGDFTTVDGVAHNRIAAFDTASGALVSAFQGSVNGRIAALAATNTTVYAGGGFTTSAGVARGRLAAFKATSGTTQTWAPAANDSVTAMVLSPDGSKVVVGGHFSTLNAASAYGMGAVATSDGSTQTWLANSVIQDAGTNGAITTLRTDGTQIYGGGYAYGSGATWEGTFALDPAKGAINWLNDCHGDTYDVFATGQVLYSVSHAHDCSAIGAFPDTNPRVWHRGLAFTTYPTGVNRGPDTYGWNYDGQPDSTLLHWYPNLTAGSYTGATQAAWSITGNSSYIALGGEFPSVNGVAQSDLVRFAVPSKAPLKTAPEASANLVPTVAGAGTGSVKVSWKADWDMDNRPDLTYKVLRDGTAVVNTVSQLSNFWTLPSLSYTDTGLVSGSQHTYKVQAIDPNGNIRYAGASSPVTVP